MSVQQHIGIVAWIRGHCAAGVLAFIFAVCNVLGYGCSGDISPESINASLILFCAVFFFGSFIVIYAILGLIQDRMADSAYVRGATARAAESTKGIIRWLFVDYPVLGPMLLILICWLPYLVICYPGTTDPYDNLDQLQQWNGMLSSTATYVNLVDPNIYLNNHHPVFHTMLLGTFVGFGTMIGSQNIGLFLFVVMQTLLFAFALAQTLALMKDFSTPIPARIFVLALYSFVPLFPGWTVCVTKDTLFTVFVILYAVCLVRIVRDSREQTTLQIVAFIAVALLMCLLRNNGIFIVVFTVPFLLLMHAAGARRQGVAGVCVALVYLLYISALLPALGISSGSVRESLSVPFQQTAYLAYAHPEDFTAEQWETVNKLFNTDDGNIGECYDSQLADSVKNNYRKETTSDDLKAYLAVWAQLGISHPLQYISVTLKNTYAYFYPGVDTAWIWPKLEYWGFGPEDGLHDEYVASGFTFEQVPAFADARKGLNDFFNFYSSSFVGLLTNMALCAWALVSAAVLMRHPRRTRENSTWKRDLKPAAARALIPFIPCFVLLLVCFAGPLNGSIRYALPSISLTPLLIAYAAYSVRVANLPASRDAAVVGERTPQGRDDSRMPDGESAKTVQ